MVETQRSVGIKSIEKGGGDDLGLLLPGRQKHELQKQRGRILKTPISNISAPERISRTIRAEGKGQEEQSEGQREPQGKNEGHDQGGQQSGGGPRSIKNSQEGVNKF